MDAQEGTKKLLEHFGSHIGMLGQQILGLSSSEQPCDVTFYRRKPALDVRIDPNIHIALMYGAGAEKLQEMLSNIRLSNGEVVSITDIWVILPMPAAGITESELGAVDLSQAEEVAGLNGETVRQMIREVPL